MSPRRCVYVGFYPLDNREDERFFAALRMTCFAITVDENCRSSVGTNCHPEEAVRQTKDLLRHWIIPTRFARVNT